MSDWKLVQKFYMLRKVRHVQIEPGRLFKINHEHVNLKFFLKHVYEKSDTFRSNLADFLVKSYTFNLYIYIINLLIVKKIKF
nr:protein [Spodoptera litura nucleopolyhedrovirus]